MDTIASLLSDTIIDSLIGKYAKFHKGEVVYCKTNQRKVVIDNVIYDDTTDGIYYDVQYGRYQYYAIPESLLIATA